MISTVNVKLFFNQLFQTVSRVQVIYLLQLIILSMIRSGKKMYVYMSDKKSLKTPKMQSESANRRRTDNTMARRERKERTNNDLQNTTKKTKD